MTMPARHDAGAVSRMLAERAELLARELLPHGRRVGREWEVGSVDGEQGRSCRVAIAGSKAGVWSDFSTGESGDALDLVAAVLFRGDRKDAFRWALSWLGLSDDALPEARRNAPRAAPPREPAADQDDVDRRRKAALQIFLSARPAIADTPVAHYLAARGIDLAVLGRQPRAIRFHPELYNRESQRAWPAMVAAISDGSGAHIATHRTWLARVDGAWRKAPLDNQKMVLGAMRGGTIRLWRGASSRPLREMAAEEEVAIGEGIETCLSVAIACPERRVLAGVSLTGIAGAELPPQCRRLLILAEKDSNPKAKLGLQRAIQAHLARDRIVHVAWPPRGNDFNDALQWRRERAA